MEKRTKRKFCAILLINVQKITILITFFCVLRYRDKKRLNTRTRMAMVSDVNDNRKQGSERQLHHYQTLLTLESVRLEHSGLYSCVPSSGLPNATVNLHVVKGRKKLFYLWLRWSKKRENNKWYRESHIRFIS